MLVCGSCCLQSYVHNVLVQEAFDLSVFYGSIFTVSPVTLPRAQSASVVFLAALPPT